MVITTLLTLMTTLSAEEKCAGDMLVDELSRLRDVSRITVSREMLNLLGNDLLSRSGFERLSAIGDKVDCIVIFNAEGHSAQVLYLTSRDLLERYRYCDLLDASDNGSTVRVTMKAYPSWNRFVVINYNGNNDASLPETESDCHIVIFNGTMTIEEMTGTGLEPPITRSR